MDVESGRFNLQREVMLQTLNFHFHSMDYSLDSYIALLCTPSKFHPRTLSPTHSIAVHHFYSRTLPYLFTAIQTAL